MAVVLKKGQNIEPEFILIFVGFFEMVDNYFILLFPKRYASGFGHRHSGQLP